MVAQLHSHDGLPLRLPLLDRAALLGLLRGIHPAFGTTEIGYADRALAVVLADAGLSEELDDVLHRIEARTSPVTAVADSMLQAWVQRHAATKLNTTPPAA